MSYPINYPTPQGANVQIFYASTESANNPLSSWIKPQGASFVWFTLIGNGGIGNGTTGGGSGAVTNFMCPAFLIPDRLSIKVGTPNSNDTVVLYQQRTTAGYTLLQANGTVGISGATANSANAFTAMGFFQSIAGQNGTSGALAASSTTFLSGGTDGTNVITGNYGYSTNFQGIFQMQPIIIGLGCNDGGTGIKRPGLGCGGSATGSFPGGPGLVVIITW